jgi:hypothetical protein
MTARAQSRLSPTLSIPASIPDYSPIGANGPKVIVAADDAVVAWRLERPTYHTGHVANHMRGAVHRANLAELKSGRRASCPHHAEKGVRL